MDLDDETVSCAVHTPIELIEAPAIEVNSASERDHTIPSTCCSTKKESGTTDILND